MEPSVPHRISEIAETEPLNPELDAAIAALGSSSKATALYTGAGTCFIVAGFTLLVSGYYHKEKQLDEMREMAMANSRVVAIPSEISERIAVIEKNVSILVAEKVRDRTENNAPKDWTENGAAKDRIENLRALAEIHVEQKEYEEAEPLLRKALDESARVFGSTDAATLTIANRVASLLTDMKRHMEAKKMYQDLVEILDSDYPNNVSKARLLIESAGVAEKAGDLESAKIFRARADLIYRLLER